MSALVQPSAPTGLLEKLVPQARAEIRIEIYLADPDDPVWGRRPCTVAGCAWGVPKWLSSSLTPDRR